MPFAWKVVALCFEKAMPKNGMYRYHHKGVLSPFIEGSRW